MNFEYAKGAGYAAVSAGPVFVLAFIAGALIADGIPARDLAVLPFALLFIVLFGVPIGAILGTIPIAFGGFVMGWLGRRFPVARRYAAWGGAGAILALPLAALLARSATVEQTAPFAATGAICALIVRYGTRWDDDSV